MVKFRKKIILMLGIFFFLFCLSSCTVPNDSIRLRIVANSNSSLDQENKHKVKEAVKDIFLKEPQIEYHQILTEIKKRIKEPFVESIHVAFCDETFPAKSYDGQFVPSGSYPTVLIVIGEGKGKNFWTLLYPEFFQISFEDDNEIEYRSYFYDLFH